MKRLYLFSGITILLWNSLNAQSFLSSDDFLINGYSKKIAGLDYDYQSCIPGLRESMLMRATSGKDFVEWETDPVPAKIKNKFATFIWVAALGSSPGKARMDLTADSKYNFSFYTDGLPAWEVKKEDGTFLSFNSIMVDQNGDNQEYMILRIPANIILITAEPEADGKSCVVHLRETNGQSALLNLTNTLNGQA